MPCRITRIISSGSMLPPESTTTVGVANAFGSSSSAATADRTRRLHDELGPLEQHQQRA